MLDQSLTIQISEMKLAVCRLPSEAPFPDWIRDNTFLSITRTLDELSIVCQEDAVPEEIEAERNWRIIKVKGPLDFSLTGILASLVTPLAEAGIPIFALSSYETDYLLIKDKYFDSALEILSRTCNIENHSKA